MSRIEKSKRLTILNKRRRLGTTEKLWCSMGELGSNNFVMVAKVKGNINEGSLRAALKDVIAAQYILRSRVVFSKKGTFLEYGQSSSGDLTIVERRSDLQWKEFAESEMNEAVPVDSFPLWRLTWLKGDGTHDLLITFNHMISDGRSGVNFFEALLQRMDNKTYKVPDNLFSLAYEEQLKSDGGLFASFRKYTEALKDFFLESKGPWTKFSGDSSAIHKTAVISVNLEQAMVDALVIKCRQEKTSVSALLAALMLNMLNPGENEKSCVSIAVDVRPFLNHDHSRDIGYFVTSIDLVKPANYENGLWALARIFKRRIFSKCHRSQFKFDQLIRYLVIRLGRNKSRFKKMVTKAVNNSMMLTNLGALQMTREFKEFELQQCFHLPAVHFMGVPFICLATVSMNDGMILNFSYTSAYFAEEQIQQWADNLVKELKDCGTSLV